MQANLKIFIEDSIIQTEELAKQVYEILGQKDNLFVEVLFVLEDEIHSLNKKFRNVDKKTDVLSFPNLDGIRGQVILKKDYPLDLTEDGERVFLGSIVICESVAKEQAKAYGHSEEREYTYLLCHGLLHLFGYDHEIEEDKKEMRLLEDKIMNAIKVYR